MITTGGTDGTGARTAASEGRKGRGRSVYRIRKPLALVSDSAWVVVGWSLGIAVPTIVTSGNAIVRLIAVLVLAGAVAAMAWPVTILRVTPDQVRLRRLWTPQGRSAATITRTSLQEVYVTPSGAGGAGTTLVVGHRRPAPGGGVTLEAVSAEIPAEYDRGRLLTRLRELLPEVPVRETGPAEALARTRAPYVVRRPAWFVRIAGLSVGAAVFGYAMLADLAELPGKAVPVAAVMFPLLALLSWPLLKLDGRGLRIGRHHGEIRWNDIAQAGLAVVGDDVEVRIVTRSNARRVQRIPRDRVDIEVVDALLRTNAPWATAQG